MDVIMEVEAIMEEATMALQDLTTMEVEAQQDLTIMENSYVLIIDKCSNVYHIVKYKVNYRKK